MTLTLRDWIEVLFPPGSCWQWLWLAGLAAGLMFGLVALCLMWFRHR
jgi:hypothetical protein